MSEDLSYARGQWISCDKALPKPAKYAGFMAVDCNVICSTGQWAYATLRFGVKIYSNGVKAIEPVEWVISGVVYSVNTTYVVAWYRVPAPEIIWVDEVDEESGRSYKVLRLKEDA